jgi:hypothetical protein
MQEIYKGRHSVQYSQVALFDAEDSNSYPIFETGEEAAILGAKGVAVATANDTEIDIVVYQGKTESAPSRFHILSGEIQVGKQSLIVGNETTADTAQISYPSGKTTVSVYVDSQSPSEVTSVVFVLDSLEYNKSN